MDRTDFNRISMGFTDTGQWKLIISIARSGISALLKNVVNEDYPVEILFSESWSPDDENLLSKIENQVYDHPRILDDFATNIIIYTPKSLWIPSELTEDEEFDSNFFTTVYTVDEDDIFMDFGDKETCLYSLAPGLNSFLQRTLPGCKISSHLSVLKELFQRYENRSCISHGDKGPDNTIYLNIRNTEADVFVFQNGEFLSGATHNWREFSDLVYKVFLAAHVYRFNINTINLNIIADPGAAGSIGTIFEEFVNNVTILSKPKLSSENGIPLATAVTAGAELI